MDFLYVGLLVVCFIVTAALIYGCERLRGRR